MQLLHIESFNPLREIITHTKHLIFCFYHPSWAAR